MIDYLGGSIIVTATGVFLHDNAFMTYMVLFAAVLGFAILVRNVGVIQATVFSFASLGIAWLLWFNAFSAAIEDALRCLAGCP
jgi:hypothetical protein